MSNVKKLPLFYKDLVPLSSSMHAGLSLQQQSNAPFAAQQHAVPLTLDEFVPASHFYPVVFSMEGQNLPFALMGLNDGINTFLDSDGKVLEHAYVPAYIRRYPFLLAKVTPESDQLSLCLDPTAPGLVNGDGGQPLFENGQPSELTKRILNFCSHYEQANARTLKFVEELKRLDLLIDGELKIERAGAASPYTYRGFKIVSEERLREQRGDTFRKLAREGFLPMIYTHLLSLTQATGIFSRQVEQGKLPKAA